MDPRHSCSSSSAILHVVCQVSLELGFAHVNLAATLKGKHGMNKRAKPRKSLLNPCRSRPSGFSPERHLAYEAPASVGGEAPAVLEQAVASCRRRTWPDRGEVQLLEVRRLARTRGEHL